MPIDGRLINEFFPDNRVRPYSSGLTRHDETLSTILLYQEGDNAAVSGWEEVLSTEGEAPRFDYDYQQFDYLSNLEREVNEISVSDVNKEIGYGSIINNPGDIAVVKLDGENNYYGVFNNFSLLEVTESTDQIKTVHVNFGSDWNAFFFGEQPRVYTFSGYFLDAKEYPFYQEFFIAYEKYLSGRRAIENKMRTKFVYDGKIVDGYMLGISIKTTAQNSLLKQFQFSVLVKSVVWTRTNTIYGNGDVFTDANGNINQSLEQRHTLNGMSNTVRHKNLRIFSSPIDSSRDNTATQALDNSNAE